MATFTATNTCGDCGARLSGTGKTRVEAQKSAAGKMRKHKSKCRK